MKLTVDDWTFKVQNNLANDLRSTLLWHRIEDHTFGKLYPNMIRIQLDKADQALVDAALVEDAKEAAGERTGVKARR